ncbi:MAG: hypothetical protein ABSA53_18055 [Streptosporangiaceae bacterium]
MLGSPGGGAPDVRIFPLGLAGSPDGVASRPPDDVEQISAAVADLQGDGPPIMPRMYVSWTGPDRTKQVLGEVGEYAALGLPWDLVLCYRDRSGSVAEWASFVSQVVAEHGHGHALAATCTRTCSGRGSAWTSCRARWTGCCAPSGNATWPEPASRPRSRSGSARTAGRPGRTGPSRPRLTCLKPSCARCTGCAPSSTSRTGNCSTLRDADSSRDGMFYHFAILRDDYSRKPAFARLRTLIAELGRPVPH